MSPVGTGRERNTMKRITIRTLVGVTLCMLAAGVILWVLANDGTSNETTTIAAEQDLPPCCQKPLDPGKPLTDGSIYQLESTWTSDVGREIQLGVLRGKPQVVTMFFASCEYACPILQQDMKRIESALPEEMRDRVGFVLITFDSERDTVEALHAYRERQDLSNRNWTLLRGEPEDVRELAALLGISYRRDPLGQFAHSNLVTLLDREGEIVRQLPGLNQAPDTAVAVLKTLVED